ncbi:hypothetical protein Vretimale_1731 [Volvox reticuliferus]|uniref:Uncharacterized protein n=1 Tax=Volvox reticuliferus TaxID=1737510 RepID=A0A8J4CRV5_9CHLO|nr:hypothetical protein Vretifemale_15397 [Volvox reticuliferus]GIL95790.1 hypothetical protein Vretimale_1731 [Volvox reticuliferus]
MDSQMNETSAAPALLDEPVQDVWDEAPAPSNVIIVPDNDPSTSVRNPHAVAHLRWVSHAPGALLLIGAGFLAAKLVKAFRRQQRELSEACKQLKSAQERLTAKEQTLEQTEARRRVEQDARVADLSQQVTGAQRELATVREMCRQAASKLEKSMSDLSVTEAELRAARAQLNTASRDLALTHAHLEATEGELGLTRSQNELMKREVDMLRRQLREAGQQLEGYIMASRNRKNAHHDADDDTRMGRSDYDDDLSVTAGWGY